MEHSYNPLAMSLFAYVSKSNFSYSPIYQLSADVTPAATLMSTIGVIALLANLTCLLLLSRHRNDNLNMSSVWLCSRNNIIANTSVLVAAGLVSLTHSVIPDLAVGFFLTVVFATSAGKVLTQSWREIAFL